MLIADTIVTKWTCAESGIQETGDAYHKLTDHLDPAWIAEWTKQESIAMRNRGDDLKIYRVVLETGISEFHNSLPECVAN